MKTLLKPGILLAFSTIVLLLAGCNSHSGPPQPKESDLVGSYRPDLKKHPSYMTGSELPPTNGVIKIEAGGKIQLVNLLDWLTQNDTNTFRKALISTNGTWTLKQSDEGWEIIAEFTANNQDIIAPLQLYFKKPPYAFRIYNWKNNVPFYFIQDKK